MTPALIPTALLLVASNVFMTFAWYGHLKYKSSPLALAIMLSWGIAFFEYCLQVPANRMGHANPDGTGGPFTAVQLKTIQEIITLLVFVGFSVLYLREAIRWNHLVGFGFIVLAAMFIFRK